MSPTDLSISPQLPPVILLALSGVAFLILGYTAWQRSRGVWWRIMVVTVGLAALTNPTIIKKEQEALPDIALVVVDDSASQGIGRRREQAQEALKQIQEELLRQANIELLTVYVGGRREDPETQMFGEIESALSELPLERLSGIILITDGQIHDASTADQNRILAEIGAPVHSLITGSPNEVDRRLVLEQVPSYGIIGEDGSIRLRVDEGRPRQAGRRPETVEIKVIQDNRGDETYQLEIGHSYDIPAHVEHGGSTVIQIEVEPGPIDLTPLNNRVAVLINGVRSRLRVLLISGEAHAGERTWRGLLKADPSVDLVHFTILRPPEKQDATPTRELSLIAFPTRELFEERLDEFDLIIFDRFRRRGVLTSAYLDNVADYVTKGGAVLSAAGPTFATALSLYATPLSRVLPGHPTGLVIKGGYRPELTEDGRRHPVTAELPGSGDSGRKWGRWFRLIDVEASSGNVLMKGTDGKPVLLLDRVGKGRVAQLLSDHAWLWTRGFEGGGPQAELLRRLAHWLMKEPDLEDDLLRATSEGTRLTITRRTLSPTSRPVTVTSPSGVSRTIDMKEDRAGLSRADLEITESGLYELDDGHLHALVAAGSPRGKEFSDLRATDEILRPVTKMLHGTTAWLSEADPLKVSVPDIRLLPEGHAMYGRDWIGLRRNDQFKVGGIYQVPLLPSALVLVLTLGGLVLAWYREGR